MSPEVEAHKKAIESGYEPLEWVTQADIDRRLTYIRENLFPAYLASKVPNVALESLAKDPHLSSYIWKVNGRPYLRLHDFLYEYTYHKLMQERLDKDPQAE